MVVPVDLIRQLRRQRLRLRLTRRAPFGEARLIDTELTVDFAKETTPRDIVSDVRFRTDFVRFTSRSRLSWWCRRRSAFDPKQSFNRRGK